jgi:GT2 family glycosyltransferase
MIKVSIIITHWNTPELLKQQLEVLSLTNHQIIVIDNNSHKSLNKIKQKFNKIKFIENKFNHGFAFANNQGVVFSKEDWLLFLNPDVKISGQEIQNLIKEAEEKSYVAIAPKAESKDYQKPVPTVLSLLVEFSPLKNIIPKFLFRKKTLVGGTLLIKKSVMRELGGWDERFFLWFEDSDLTRRLIKNKHNYGFAEFSVNHLGGKSFKILNNKIKRALFFNSMDIYSRKHFNFFGKLVVSLIRKKYSKDKVLPVLNSGVTMTVPNMKRELLISFLGDNKRYIKDLGELVVVSSSLNTKLYWQLKSVFQNLRLISLEKNKGFAPTVNVGFRTATTAWFGTVNDDVTLNSLWLAKCMKCAKDKVGSINPVIKDKKNNVESVGVSLLPKGKAVTLTEIPNKSCIGVQASNAACVLYSNEALNKVGLFDERFGSYLEDIDLSLRLMRIGFKNVVSTSSFVLHEKHQTSKTMGRKKRWLDFKNWWLVIAKNWSFKDIIKNLPQITLERMKNLAGFIKN